MKIEECRCHAHGIGHAPADPNRPPMCGQLCEGCWRDGCDANRPLPKPQPSLRVVPVSWAEARDFVAAWHRHNEPPNGHRFSVGVAASDVLVGVAIVSHPIARFLMDGRTLEVIRTATDGTPNANSMLYGTCWRAAKALGYDRLITYTQHDESGASLRAAGWTVVAERAPRPGWNTPSRPREDKGTAGVARTLWEVIA